MSPTKLWSLGAGLVAVALLVAGWMFGISPQRAHASDLRGQAASQRQADAGIKTKIATLKAQQSDAPQQTARLAAIAQRVPDNPALPALVRSLVTAAEAAGVDLVGITPNAPAPITLPKAAATSSAGAGGDDAAPAASAAVPLAPTAALSQITLNINIIGGYANIQQFLAQLEDLSRALVVDSLTVAPGTPLKPTSTVTLVGSGDTKWTTLNATITARIFLTANQLTAVTSALGTAGATSSAPSPSEAPSTAPTTPSN